MFTYVALITFCDITLTFHRLLWQRNIGNVFHDDDPAALSVLTFAINALGVEAIMVVGTSLFTRQPPREVSTILHAGS